MTGTSDSRKMTTILAEEDSVKRIRLRLNLGCFSLQVLQADSASSAKKSSAAFLPRQECQLSIDRFFCALGKGAMDAMLHSFQSRLIFPNWATRVVAGRTSESVNLSIVTLSANTVLSMLVQVCK
jgi:hypothetical protein